ncbi:MAG: NAD(P)/FAD-dependent oxidoreductase [Dehalococcoidia bacterium]
MNIGIIGAGAAGLAAAYDLVKKGYRPTVYEASPRIGGQASTFDVGGGRLERGYHHLFTSDTYMIDLIDELGLGPKLAWIQSKVGFYHKGKIYDFVTPRDLLKFSPISLVDRIRLGLVSLYLRRTRNWHKFENVTASEWIKKWAGRRNYEVVWGPLLRGKFGDSAEEIGMVWFWGKIYIRFASRGRGLQKEKLGYPMGSFGEVFEILAEQIRKKGGEVHLSTPVTRIKVANGKAVGLEVKGPDGAATSREFDLIISTTPSYLFPKLVPELPEDYVQKLCQMKYHAAVLVILVLKHPLSHIYWLNLSDYDIPFLAVIEQTNFVDKSLYGGKHVVYLSNYLGKENPMYSMTQDQLLAEYVPHLKQINPQFEPSWIEEYHYHREEAAQPIVTTNYSSKIPEHRTPIKGLYLANTTQIYPEDRGTNYSVRLGQQISRLVLEDAGP